MADPDTFKTADDVRDLMLQVIDAYSTERKAEVDAIFIEALGLADDMSGRRDPMDLQPAEVAEACIKLQLSLDNGPKPSVENMLAESDRRIRKFNEPRKGEANKGRPRVEIKNSFLPQAIAKVERLLIMEARTIENVEDRIFQRDGKLVRLNRNLLPDGIEHDDEYRENNALLIVEVRPKWLANRLDRSIQFVGAAAGNPDKQSDRKSKPVPKNASAELCARMLEDSSRWRHPYLYGTIEAPTLRPDGTVLDSKGYDKRTGLFFDPGETVFPRIPSRPTFEDGLNAIREIEGLLCDFPFQDVPGYEGVSKAVALAAILTGPVRRTLDIAPAFAVTAKEAETGKTELSKLVAGITVGREVSGQPFSDSEEERRKAIGANLRAGRPILFFDNADNVVIEGDFIEKMVTLPSITDRVLSMTEEYTAPTNCLVLFNGNHISVGGAMTTRVLLSRIVSDMPLAKRRFKYPDLFKYVIEHRPELVWAVLTALRAWLVNGTPDPARNTSRFPAWDRLVAQALVWYGYADPMRGGDELREDDPVMEAKREVVRQWAAAFGDTTITALELQKHGVVRQAIANSRRGQHERDVTPTMISKYLNTLDGVRLDMEWKPIKGAARKGHPQQWRLEWCGDGEAPAPEIAAEMDTTAAEDFEDA